LDHSRALGNQTDAVTGKLWTELKLDFPWLSQTQDYWPAKAVVQTKFHNLAARSGLQAAKETVEGVKKALGEAVDGVIE
jgi:hypothetical protein